MTVTLDLPDDIAQALASAGDLPRRALEALAVEGFRAKRLTQLQVGRLLGLARLEAEDFLAAHLDLYDYDPGDLQGEYEALEKHAARSPGA